MPTATFHNLPAHKRQSLIDAAIDEFAQHPYGVASVSQIVQRAGIAKGSIYQYFADKQDFYLFLVEHAAAEQLRLLQELAPAEDTPDVFAQLRRQMSATVRVGLAAPRLARLVARAVGEDLPFRDELAQRLGSARLAHFRALVEAGIARGEIDPALDPETAAAAIAGLTGALGALVLSRLGIAPAEALDDLSRLDTPEVERIYDDVLQIVRHGLAPAHSCPTGAAP